MCCVILQYFFCKRGKRQTRNDSNIFLFGSTIKSAQETLYPEHADLEGTAWPWPLCSPAITCHIQTLSTQRSFMCEEKPHTSEKCIGREIICLLAY